MKCHVSTCNLEVDASLKSFFNNRVVSIFSQARSHISKVSVHFSRTSETEHTGLLQCDISVSTPGLPNIKVTTEGGTLHKTFAFAIARASNMLTSKLKASNTPLEAPLGPPLTWAA